MASGQVNVPILELTQAADVGLGSFYNHFASKEELFRAALEAALDAYGDLLDQLTIGLDDPAEVFVQSFRLTGRLHRRQPQLSKVLLHNAMALVGSTGGLAPRARRDLDAAARAGRFTIVDPELTMTIVAAPPSASANSCMITPTATTRRPPTTSPRTCSACSASPRTKHTRSASGRCRTSATSPTPRGLTQAGRPRR
jgi:AcrR family transcriptional regulator